MKNRILLIISVFFSITIYSQNTYVFFGSFNRDKTSQGIFVYELDTIKMKLIKVTTVKNILNPSYLTLSPDGKYVFACTESKTKNAGSVSSFAFNPENKTLTFINSQKSGGENPVYLTVHQNGKWLINGNYTEGSASVYPISENGTIQPMVQSFQFTEGSLNKVRQERSHIHATVFSPDFQYIFMPDLGADKIRCYKFNDQKNKPLESCKIPFTKTSLGSGPRHLTFHPNGKFAYCIEELTGTVSAFRYSDGTLESSDIHISPDGLFLYASNRGF